MTEDTPGLRIGIQVNTAHRVFRWPEIRELALAVEDAGLASLWSEDHLYYSSKAGDLIGPWDAVSTLSALAEATNRVRIGTFVSSLNMHRPAQLAKAAVTLDEISGGRFVLGVGTGWNAAEHAAVGVSLEKRVARFEESLSVLLELFDTGHSEHHGTHLEVDARLVPTGLVRKRPEMIVGSGSPRVLRAALPHVQGWNWDGFENAPDEFQRDWQAVAAVAEEVGRNPDDLVPSAHVIARLPDAGGLPIDPLPEGFRQIGGSASEIADSFAAFARAGARELMLVVDPPTPSSIDLLARAAEMLQPGP